MQGKELMQSGQKGAAMTAEEIRNKVINKYKVGQVITLFPIIENKKTEEKKTRPVVVKIIKFHPNIVLTERKGFKRCYTYWEILNMAKNTGKTEINIPESLKRRKETKLVC